MNIVALVIDTRNGNRPSIDIDPVEIPFDAGSPHCRLADPTHQTIIDLVSMCDEINADTADAVDMQVVWNDTFRPVRAVCVHCGDIEDVNRMIPDDDGLSCGICAD